MKKKIIAAMLCIAMMATGLAGCGNNQEQSTTGGGAAAGGNDAAVENGTSEQNNASDGEVVKLRMMGYNAESVRATYLKYLDEQLPNIEIEFEFVSNDNYMNVLNSQLQAGEGPDIIEAGGQTKLLAKAGYLLDLSDQEFISKYADSGLSASRVDGKVYAIPLQSWFEGVFYNKKIFRENNLSIPKTWDEFIALHKTLEEKGIKPQTMGAQSWEPMNKTIMGLADNMFYSDPANSGFDETMNDGTGRLAEAFLPAAEEWYKIIEAGGLTQDMLGLSYDQALDEFATEKAAMWQCGPWAVSTIMEKNPDIELGMFPIPGTDASKPGWLVGGPGSCLAVNAKSENIEAALQVLEMTSTEEAQKALIADNAGSSYLVGVEVDLGDIYSDCDEAFKLGNVYAPFTAAWTNGQAIIESFGKSLQEVLSGSKTVQEALEDADATNLDLLETME